MFWVTEPLAPTHPPRPFKENIWKWGSSGISRGSVIPNLKFHNLTLRKVEHGIVTLQGQGHNPERARA
jgi:hypothetical protein